MKFSPKSPIVRIKKSTARAAGDVTRERMLDTAEECFATHGFHGTSMRDIARGASTPIALVSYHFKSKDNLFDRVIERRATYMGFHRMNALQKARASAGDKPIALQMLIESYVWPFINYKYTHASIMCTPCECGSKEASSDNNKIVHSISIGLNL